MKAPILKCLTLLCVAVCLGWLASPSAFAFSDPAPAAARGEKQAAPKQDPEEINVFRHAPAVQMFARLLGIDTETAARIFEVVNSAILLFAIAFLLAKVVPKAIRERRASIQKRLIEAREATETANQRLSAVEAKLARIGEDIEAIRGQAEREMVEDERRIQQSLEEERRRIVQSVEQEIESAGAAAQRELKRFAAGLAVDAAARRIRLSYDSDKALVERFGRNLAGEFGKGGQN